MIKSKKITINSAFIHLILAGVLILWMIPVIYMFGLALRSPDQIFDPRLFVMPITFDNIIKVITENPLYIFFINSLIITLTTVISVVIISSLFSFAITILKLPGSLVFYSTIITTLMVPITSLVLPLAILLKNFGLTNHYLGLILPYVALGVPFAVVILKGFLESSPKDLFEASRIDGCNSLQIYWHVALPLIRSSLVFIAIWQFITTWNEFFLAFVIMSENKVKTLTIIPMQYSGFYMANPGALFAILSIIALPLIILYVFVQKAFVHGLSEGALKG